MLKGSPQLNSSAVVGSSCPTVKLNSQQTLGTLPQVEEWVPNGKPTGTLPHEEEWVAGRNVLAEIKLRCLRMLLAKRISLIRIRQFAGCEAEKVIEQFEAMLASSSITEAMFIDCIELAQLLLH